MFGSSPPQGDSPSVLIDRTLDELRDVRRELAEAKALIERLKDALGPNHPLGNHHPGIF
jgi:hypothetical protein